MTTLDIAEQVYSQNRELFEKAAKEGHNPADLSILFHKAINRLFTEELGRRIREQPPGSDVTRGFAGKDAG